MVQIGRTIGGLAGGGAGIVSGFLAIYLAIFAPSNDVAKHNFVVAAAVLSGVAIIGLTVFGICEYLRDHSAEKREAARDKRFSDIEGLIKEVRTGLPAGQQTDLLNRIDALTQQRDAAQQQRDAAQQQRDAAQIQRDDARQREITRLAVISANRPPNNPLRQVADLLLKQMGIKPPGED